MAVWLLDCGNSLLKVRRYQEQATHRLQRPQELSAHGLLAGDSLVTVSSRPAVTESVRALCEANGYRFLLVGEQIPVPDFGQYAACGVDRVVAACAGLASAGQVLVSAGTATTITAWAWSQERPCFQGGLVLPGAEASRKGLLQAAPHLAESTIDWSAQAAAQRDSVGALQAGLSIGYIAMIAACVDQLRRETGIEQVTISGGAAAAWDEHDRLPSDWAFESYRVLRGLASRYFQPFYPA